MTRVIQNFTVLGSYSLIAAVYGLCVGIVAEGAVPGLAAGVAILALVLVGAKDQGDHSTVG